MARRKRKKITISKKTCIFITLIVVVIGLTLIVLNRTILKEPEHKIYFHKSSAEIYIGDQTRFGYTITNVVPNEKIMWTTSNSKVATVDANGKIKGISFGDVTITAELSNGASASARLRVKSYPVRLVVNTDIEPIKGWFNRDVYVTFDTLNIEEIKYCMSKEGECTPNLYYKDKIKVSNGVWFMYIGYVDKNGKKITHREIFKIDLVKPKCDISRIGKLNEETSTIDIICTEGGSGVSRYEWYRDNERIYITDKSLTYAKEIYASGKHKYSVRVYDVAGNFIEYKIDN